ncbi:bacteriocin immunity protein [Pseudomonas neuropathica]|nr:bacteriocin immunity protein [Pseudomonas neuropathica]
MREEDFLEFVKKIYNSGFATEKQQITAILEFSRLVEHPSGHDLIYYP